MRGDVTKPDGTVDIDDVAFLAAYVNGLGPAPNPLEMGDANAAFDMWKMRNDPEFAAAERAKTMAIPLDEGTYEAIDEQFTEQEPAATGVEKYIQITNQ